MVFPLEAPFSSGISQPRLIFRMGMQSGRPNDNWLVVWNMFFFFNFSIQLGLTIPTDAVHHFSEEVYHQPDTIII